MKNVTIIIATAAIALSLAACSPSTPTAEPSAPSTSATVSPSPSPEVTAGPTLAMSCRTSDGAIQQVEITREPESDFSKAWALEGVDFCTNTALKVVPSTPAEKAAYQASGYASDDLASLYSLCAAVDADHTYVDRDAALSAAQTNEVRAVLSLCPGHPLASLMEAKLTPADEGAPPNQVSSPAAEPTYDLMTDAGLCAADADMTNLELNDAIAPKLGYLSDRDLRTSEQDEAIRDYKNAAFLRACPARAG